VPIRPDSGEAAPNRAQPQPRVVPAAPRASEPDLSNAPLRITPQSVRQTAVPAQSAPAPAPRVQPGTVPSSVPSLDADAPATPAAPIRTASTGGSFTVQLAAEGSEDAARAKFNRMRSQYGSVLGSEQANIRSAEVNGRSVYRVRVGSMSREEAVSMCERLKASGGSCFVARN
jgi:cell division septation protein DedD